MSTRSTMVLLTTCLLMAPMLGATEPAATLGGPGEDPKSPTQDEAARLYWKDGIRFDLGERSFKFGGRIMNDWTYSSGLMDFRGTEFRRARLYLSGDIAENVDFKAQYDFAGGDADVKDMWFRLKGLGPGDLKIGHFKEPFGLEELTSSKYITFMERALPMVMAPSRNTGFGYNGGGDGYTWAFGIWRPANSYGDDKTGASTYNLTGRFTFTPWNEDGGASLLHLGAAVSRRDLGDTGAIQVKSSPESHLLGSGFYGSGVVGADGATLFGLEAAWVEGPFSLQGEYVQTDVNALAGADPTFSGWYLQGSWFVTGEHRSYKHGAFSRIKPATVFGGEDEGCGAWELALRYSSLDLSDGPAATGTLDDVTIGANWYLNPNTRIMFDYTRADLQGFDATDIFQTRFQVDF
ncbi:MAG: porin [Planctomycetota bacterium]|nr:MAG: porin [Planctomycetota bacterium]